MTWWNRKSKPSDEPEYIRTEIPNVRPGMFVPCEEGAKLVREQVGHEWMEWSFREGGIPWRTTSLADRRAFSKLLMDGWNIVAVFKESIVLNRPEFVHYLDTPKIKPRRKK